MLTVLSVFLQYKVRSVVSNGGLDPWSGGGVLKDLSPSLVSILIPEGAHHLDLRASNPNDPPSVTSAREREKSIIKQWIAEYQQTSAEVITGDCKFAIL